MATIYAWSDTDKTASVTLSNSDRTATTTTAADQGVKSTQTRAYATTGKWYAEFVADINLTDWTCGIHRLALDNPNGGILVTENGEFVVNGTVRALLGTLSNGDVISIAWDSGGNLAWARINSGNWNNSGTANPDTGTGGWSTTGLSGSGNMALYFFAFATGAKCTVRTQTADFTIASRPTTNFRSWMDESLVGAIPYAWSNVDKDAAVVLTNSDRTARCSTTAGTGVRSTQRRLYATTGKWYAEFVVDNRVSSDWTAGMSRAALSSGTGAIVDGAGNIKINNIFQTAIGSLANNDVISIAWDSGGNLFWAHKNSGLWNNSGTADPDTGVGGFDTSFLAGSGDVPLSFYGLIANTQCTIRTRTADFTIASRPTVNFRSWMNESLIPANQNLDPALYTDPDTFFVPAVSAGALFPALYTDPDSFYTAVVTRGPVGLAPSLYTDPDTFPAAIVGPPGLTPGLYSDPDVFYTGRLGLYLTTALHTDPDSFHAPVVGRGTITMIPSLYTDSDTFYRPTVFEGLGDLIVPDLYIDPDSFFAFTVSYGVTTLRPSLFVDGDQFFDFQPPPGASGRRGGLVTVVKRWRPPEPETVAPIPLPPFRRPPQPLTAQRAPVEIVVSGMSPANLLGLQEQVFSAQDIADVNAYLADLDQDEQDAEDIADLLARLD